MEKYRNTESNNNNNNLDLIRISCLRNPRITKGKGTWCHITSCTSMQTSWMSCSWFWAPWQPYPMGSSSPHCLLSRKEWSTRSEIWSQIHSFCTRELARYVSNFGTWLRLARALEIFLPSYCGYFLSLMMFPYQTFLKHGTLNECLWISKILDWFSLQWILSFVSNKKKKKKKRNEMSINPMVKGFLAHKDHSSVAVTRWEVGYEFCNTCGEGR